MSKSLRYIPLLFNRVLGISRSPLPREFASMQLAYPLPTNGNFMTGIYTDYKGAYFIKVWRGYFTDLNYDNLCNEKLVVQSLSRLNNSSYYHLPRLRQVVQARFLLALVYDYIHGMPLEDLPPSFQSSKLLAIKDWLAKYSFTHGDLTPDNVFIRGQSTYILDWEEASYAKTVASHSGL